MTAVCTGVALALAAGYSFLMQRYRIGWEQQPCFVAPETMPEAYLSVLIPARNERGGISACLRSIVSGDYPAHHYEIIVIDDGSDDGTAAAVTLHFPQVKVLQLSRPCGKKAAVAAGVAAARGQYVVCTDADCIVPPSWLRLFAAAFEQGKYRFVTGPVLFYEEKNAIEWFQTLDFMGMMGITAAGIHQKWQNMANGANMGYSKATFEVVKGYSGNEHIASGDDMFLVQKVAQHWPGSVFFLKSPDAIVKTRAMPDWRSFIRQRVRWGGKNAALPEWPVRLSLAWVLLTTLSIPVFILLALAGYCPWGSAATVLAVKMLNDWFFLRQMSDFFQRREAMRWFLPAQGWHIVYIISAGVASIWKRNTRWK